jgi:16S rRNA (cytosine967-C5)-methyltransferase
VHELPGFAEGLVSVQDLGAQCVAFPLDLAPGQRVLDACAAPGGKTALMAEREPDLSKLVAVDVDPQRLARVRRTCRAETCRPSWCTATRRATWWDGVPFDRILLDAPCSALGVIRRHPDIRLRKSPSDIDKLPQLQARLLQAGVAHAGAGRAPGLCHLHGDSQRKPRCHRRLSRGHSRRQSRPGGNLGRLAGFR